MQDYVVKLQSPISKHFRSQKAANSLDIDVEKKSKHELFIRADVSNDFHIGLIIGASGSGKTTLIKNIWGDDCLNSLVDLERAIIEQFPEEWTYDECAEALSGIGLTSVPCWIRPVKTLSTGQRARAEAALQMAQKSNNSIPIIFDEWTSTVDRNVAKVMSHCIAKYARRRDRKVILIGCHYDVLDWLDPDWVIDCNKQTYIDRRSMVGAHERTDRLRCDIREIDRTSWPYFSKYHYLSSNLPGGKLFIYGLFIGYDQIGFQCFAQYVPNQKKMFHSNRTVIHPDYAGLGLGIKLINETSKEMTRKGYVIKAKFSSTPIFKAMNKQKEWRLSKIEKPIKAIHSKLTASQDKSRRTKTITYHFDFIWREDSSIVSHKL